MENHLAACERLYLVRRLQPWHRHAGTHLSPLGDPRFLAVPLEKLWEV